MLSAYLHRFLPVFHKIGLRSASARELHQPGHAGNTPAVSSPRNKRALGAGSARVRVACHYSTLGDSEVFKSSAFLAKCTHVAMLCFQPAFVLTTNKNPNLKLDSTTPQYCNFLRKDPQMEKNSKFGLDQAPYLRAAPTPLRNLH